MAAVLACGDGAVVSHGSAARLWELLPEQNASAAVEVTVSRSSRARRTGVLCHRGQRHAPNEVTTLQRLPITTPTRTLLDIANAVGRRDLELALSRALTRGVTSEPQLRALLGRYPRRGGARGLRMLLDGEEPLTLTRSEAEERFLTLIRKAQLPLPETNVSVTGYEVDFYWRPNGFVVEIDGFAFHSSAEMFESDRRRDAVLAASGVRVMRATWRQLTREPEALLVRLTQALAKAGPA
jgi:very-short-patch-repair endonuclease